MASISLPIEPKYFPYGCHKIPLGKPYAYRIENNTVNLYCYGGMGLEASEIHPVTFQFPTESAEKVSQVVEQILDYTGPLPNRVYGNKQASLLRAFTNNMCSEAYEVTLEKVKKATRVSRCASFGGEITTTSEIYEYDDEDMSEPAKRDVEQLKSMQQRIDVLIEKRPDYEVYFTSLRQQIALAILNENPTSFDAVILCNHLEMVDLKHNVNPLVWHAFLDYLCRGIESDDAKRIIEASRKDLPQLED